LLSAQEINTGISEMNGPTEQRAAASTRIFLGVQNLLNAAANISKACWGASGKRAADRQPLRDSIGITDASPLFDMSMRNNFEHYDERLDRWWRESRQHNYVDFAVGRSSVAGVDPIEMFREYHPTTTDVAFWGETFNIQALVNEVMRILPAVEREAAKPPEAP
jgi:hypothetical protein